MGESNRGSSKVYSCYPGHLVLMDDEYVHNGAANIFLEVKPLEGKRNDKTTKHRTRINWAHFIKEMLARAILNFYT